MGKGEMGTKSCLLAVRAYKEAGWRDGTRQSAWFGWYGVLARWHVSFKFTWLLGCGDSVALWRSSRALYVKW